MVFSSLPFLFLFLPVFLCFYCLLPARNLVALIFSLCFYAWGEGLYVAMLMLTIGVNYVVGRWITLRPGSRLPVGIGVGFNLSLLFWFKYAAFLLNEVAGLGITADNLPRLPLGISFFIFQSISYLVDIWRREEQAANSLVDLATYISMFPQLIAGPIVRYSQVAAHLRTRTISLQQVRQGLQLFVLGLCQKVLIANNVAEVADTVFDLPAGEVSTLMAWVGTLAYSLQIFHDFAGYSLMAIGLGMVMGFRFPENFNFPYIARSITEFWRRWHMTLSSWFRDYLYIPLGGNRKGRLRTFFNLYAVFLLCGLWHGAAWTFVAWGAFHGTLLVLEKSGFGRLLERFPAPLAHGYTLLMVMISWVIFRSTDFAQAWELLGVMAGRSTAAGMSFAQLVSHENLAAGVLGVIFSIPVWRHARAAIGTAFQPVARRQPRLGGWVQFPVMAGLFLLCAMYLYSGSYNPFIYFRF